MWGTNKLITNHVDMMDVGVACVGVAYVGVAWVWFVWVESKSGGVKKVRSQKRSGVNFLIFFKIYNLCLL